MSLRHQRLRRNKLNMRYCGISEDFHDASIAFIEEDGTVSFTA